jgi:type III pantothenate kinase
MSVLQNIDLRTVSAVCLSSVVPMATLALTEFAREWLGLEPLVVSSGLNLNVRLGMDRPGDVGADRIANASAAWDHYRGACIVVDLGTATKVEAITANGEFAGGSIAAGLGVSLEALTARAAKLFDIPLLGTSSPIGRNTSDALQSGLVNGHMHLVAGLIADIRREIGESAPVVVTGGFVSSTGSPFRRLGTHMPDLTLDGVRLIHGLNTGHG